MNAQEFYNQNKDKNGVFKKGSYHSFNVTVVGFESNGNYNLLLRLNNDDSYGAPLNVFKRVYAGLVTHIEEDSKHRYLFGGPDEITIDAITPIVISTRKPCSCDLTTLMRSGCKCGGI